MLDNYISISKEYKYLGVYVTESGNFNIDHLLNKARKAMFALRKRTNDIQLLPKVHLDLFNCLILPILTYVLEVWGCETILKNRCKSFSSFLGRLEKHKIEKLYMNFIRCVLGVNKRSSHCAMRGEVGAFPVGINILKNVLKYFIYLK